MIKIIVLMICLIDQMICFCKGSDRVWYIVNTFETRNLCNHIRRTRADYSGRDPIRVCEDCAIKAGYCIPRGYYPTKGTDILLPRVCVKKLFQVQYVPERDRVPPSLLPPYVPPRPIPNIYPVRRSEEKREVISDKNVEMDKNLGDGVELKIKENVELKELRFVESVCESESISELIISESIVINAEVTEYDVLSDSSSEFELISDNDI